MPEELGERTEAPTSRRRGEVRGRGQVPKSVDFGASIDLIGAVVLLVVMGSSLFAGLGAIVRHLLDSRSSGQGLTAESVDGYLRWAAGHAAMLAAPFLLVMFAVAALAQFFQVGWLFTLAPLQPKLDRLNPLAGIKRLFGRRSLIRTLVAIVKLCVVGAVVVNIVISEFPTIAALSLLEAAPGFALMLRIILRVSVWMLAIMVIIGLVDLWYQRWQQTQDMKMTKQEVKDEQRSMEGDMETKGRRLRMARQIALQRIRQSVPKADVIVTNPTHFSVAIQYDAKTMAAPKVVAKGADFLAFRIREIATAHGIPIVERPPLARALYDGVPVGRAISQEFYEAVAEILAYVYRLEGKAA